MSLPGSLAAQLDGPAQAQVERARRLAVSAHATQTYAGEPYVSHLEEVVLVLAQFGWTATHVLCAGYLHDAVEDTPLGPSELRAEFGEEVARLVFFYTDEPGPDRKQRKALTYARMGEQAGVSDPWIEEAVCVKLADRLANARRCVADSRSDLLGMYRKEHREFASALRRFEAHEPMWSELDELLEGG